MSQTLAILSEAKRLYQLGWSVHWIKPNSKAPVKSGWSSGERDKWDTIERDYRKGFGLGVRLGALSKLDSGYLANIDVDIKSSEKHHRKEALAALEKEFPGLLGKAPIVKTGMGLRLFVKTPTPVTSKKLTTSEEVVKVMLKGSEVNRRQEALLDSNELNQGLRVRKAWEIEFMSQGKQVVLPPSIHPETKKLYEWLKPCQSQGDIPEIKFLGGLTPSLTTTGEKASFDFNEIVDLSRLSDETRTSIIDGVGIVDHSSAVFSITLTMLNAGFTKEQILNVLTNKSYYLGTTAYEHAKTNNRDRAANWLKKYCINKAENMLSLETVFKDKAESPPLLKSEKETKAQFKELVEDYKDTTWRAQLTRMGKGGSGPIGCTLPNVVLILENAVDPNVFRLNSFAQREIYGCDTPWGGRKDELLTDVDTIKVRYWLENGEFHVKQPSSHIVFDAMVFIAAKNEFHPLRDELNALPEWDGSPRLDTWLAEYFEAKGPDYYLAQAFRKWMVGLVTRVFDPGHKIDQIPIFQGRQGTGKSSFGEILVGEKYFLDNLPPLHDKDAALNLQGIWCVEFAELDNMRRTEVETAKAFISRKIDKVRPPFGKRWIESRRQCSFLGTTNKDSIFKDDENRRYNPIEVGQLDFKALRRDRDQLLAEALFIYQNFLEPDLNLEGKAKTFAEESRKDKTIIDEGTFMVENLVKFISVEKAKKEGGFDLTKFKLSGLFRGFGGGGPFESWPENGKNIQLAAKALKEVGALKVKINGESWWKVV